MRHVWSTTMMSRWAPCQSGNRHTHARTHTHTHTHTHICTHTHTHIYIHIHIYTNKQYLIVDHDEPLGALVKWDYTPTNAHTYIHTHKHTHIYTNTYTRTHTQYLIADNDEQVGALVKWGQTHARTYTHTHTHTHIYIYVYTHTHTKNNRRPWWVIEHLSEVGLDTHIHTYTRIYTHKHTSEKSMTIFWNSKWPYGRLAFDQDCFPYTFKDRNLRRMCCKSYLFEIIRVSKSIFYTDLLSVASRISKHKIRCAARMFCLLCKTRIDHRTSDATGTHSTSTSNLKFYAMCSTSISNFKMQQAHIQEHQTWDSRGNSHTISIRPRLSFRYCSTVQGLLDWFEVDVGFTERLFIQINLCVTCVFVHDSPVCNRHTISIRPRLWESLLLKTLDSQKGFISAQTRACSE